MTRDERPCHRSRRALIAAAVASVSGCTGGLSGSSLSCRGGNGTFRTDAVDLFGSSFTTNNAGEGGTCTRWSSAICLLTTLHVDPEVVARVEGRTTEGETVATADVDGGVVHKLQVAEIDRAGRAEREVVLLDHDGREIERASVFLDCE